MRAIACVLALALSPCAFALGSAPAPTWSFQAGARADLKIARFRGSVPTSISGPPGVPRRLSMPALDALYKRTARAASGGGRQDVPAAEAKRFLAKVAVTFRSRAAPAAASAPENVGANLPRHRKGVVRKVHRGFTEETAATLEREIDALLKEPS
jgi:hypothetical protein